MQVPSVVASFMRYVRLRFILRVNQGLAEEVGWADTLQRGKPHDRLDSEVMPLVSN